MAKEILEPDLLSLEDILKNSIFNIPIYQRPYSWGSDEIDVLLNDINNEFEKSHFAEYYVGNIIIYDMDEKISGTVLKYDIIDGQQRILTFSLMLLAIYTLTKEIGIGDTDNTVLKIKEILWKYINRNYNKDLRVVIVNGIEKECYEKLYDKCYTNPLNILEYCNNYEPEPIFEERIIENFLTIRKYIFEHYGNTSDSLLTYADYLLHNMKLIQIQANCNEKDVFSMFESINSKGKKLEEIDLIKSYIFSVLDVSAYDDCSKIWGKLIIETEDDLYNYLYIYIKSYITYYRQKFSANNFRNLCQKSLKSHFNVTTESEAIKLLLEDMDKKINSYKLLYSTELAYKTIKRPIFRFYYSIFVKNGYEHPRPLFFRMFNDLAEEKITQDDAVDIVIETTLFMLKFMTILGRDSKDAITTFSNILNYTYDNEHVDKQNIINEEENLLKSQNVNNDILIGQLASMDSYTAKNCSVALLSLITSTEVKEDGTYHVSYDQAFELYSSFSKVFSIDHLMVQSPDEKDNMFKYYKVKDQNDNDILELKEGNDFPPDLVSTGMDYDQFTKLILNRIGNLRIWYKDKNSSRQNTAINLPESESVNNFEEVKERSNKILKLLFNILPEYKINNDFVNRKPKRKLTKKFDDMRMQDLLDLDEIHINDKIYLTSNPDNSEATLLDENHVLYNGKRMTLNEWGLLITQWKSINIYHYVAILGETETLQEKRERYINI